MVHDAPRALGGGAAVTALFGATPDRGSRPGLKAQLIRECAEPLDAIETADLGGFLERAGDARVVLLGEATHGTAEFYRMRARITQELVTRRGFTIVAVEADWPDAARVDRYVRDADGRPMIGKAFARFPSWMWRNREVRSSPAGSTTTTARCRTRPGGSGSSASISTASTLPSASSWRIWTRWTPMPPGWRASATAASRGGKTSRPGTGASCSAGAIEAARRRS